MSLMHASKLRGIKVYFCFKRGDVHNNPQEIIFNVKLRPPKKCLVSRPLKIEKVMRACNFYFYFSSFLQGQIEIFQTRIILHFAHIMSNVFLS